MFVMRRSTRLVLLFLIMASVTPMLLPLENIDPALDWQENVITVANVLGLVGTLLLMWQYVLGSRHTAKAISEDLVTVNSVHQLLGKYGLLLIFVHPILQMIAAGEGLLWLLRIDLFTDDIFEQLVSFGRVAVAILLLVWLTSAILRGRLRYRPWLYVHYVAYPVLGLVLLHSQGLAIYINAYEYIGLLWAVLPWLFAALLLYRVLLRAGFGKVGYELISRQPVGEEILLLTFAARGDKRIVPRPGQFVYLQARRFGEAHPFTVMHHDAATGRLTFGIKRVGGYSTALHDLQVGAVIFADGPYGVFTQEAHNDAPKVLIAGGIGITPFVDVVGKYGAKNTILLNCNRQLEDVVWRAELIAVLGRRYRDFLSDDARTDQHIVNGRISAAAIMDVVGAYKLPQYNFFICASPELTAAVKVMLAELKVPEQRIFTEEFTL